MYTKTTLIPHQYTGSKLSRSRLAVCLEIVEATDKQTNKQFYVGIRGSKAYTDT